MKYVPAQNLFLAQKIRILRDVYHYTQEYIANMIGVSPNTYCLMEKGEARFTIDRIDGICKIYEISTHDLLEADEKTIVFLSKGCQSKMPNGKMCIPKTTQLSEWEHALYTKILKSMEDDLKRWQEEVHKLYQLLNK